jgi:putative membrane protein
MMNEMDRAWGMGWGWIIGLIVLVIVIWLIVRVVNQKKIPEQPVNKTPLDILNERYARGEISKDEYAVKKKAIS